MKLSTQKIISSLLISIVVIFGFEAIIYILNLNQPATYLRVAFWIYLYLMFEVVLLYDLHIRQPGSIQRAKIKHAAVVNKTLRWGKIISSAIADRWYHLRKLEHIEHWIYFLFVPTFIFWSTVTLFFVNFGNLKLQELLAILSSFAIIVYYWFIKEAFHRGKDVVDADIFVVLSMVKIFTAAILYAASLSVLRYYCLDPIYFSTSIFCFTFLLIFQALYQHKFINGKNMLIALAISLIMAILGRGVYLFWGFNYFTAAVFLGVCYNLMWGLFHYSLDKALTKYAFWEILFISFIIIFMVVSVTNFKARISGGCQYFLSL